MLSSIQSPQSHHETKDYWAVKKKVDVKDWWTKNNATRCECGEYALLPFPGVEIDLEF